MSFIEKIQKVSSSVDAQKERVLLLVKKDIERMANGGSKYTLFYPYIFKRLVANAIENSDYGNELVVSFEMYHDMLYFVMNSLQEEGFKVFVRFNDSSNGEKIHNMYFTIEW